MRVNLSAAFAFASCENHESETLARLIKWVKKHSEAGELEGTLDAQWNITKLHILSFKNKPIWGQCLCCITSIVVNSSLKLLLLGMGYRPEKACLCNDRWPVSVPTQLANTLTAKKHWLIVNKIVTWTAIHYNICISRKTKSKCQVDIQAIITKIVTCSQVVIKRLSCLLRPVEFIHYSNL